MKFTKFLLSCVIIVAAAYGAVKLFSPNNIEVTAKTIKKESFTPYVYLGGSVVDASQIGQGALQTGVGNNEKRVVVLASQNSAGKIKVGQKAVISASGLEKDYKASVISVSDDAKKITVGTSKAVVVEVVLRVDNPDSDLKNGFNANAKIFTDEKTDILVVPYRAVFSENDREYVYVINDGKAQKREVKTDRELENGYEIVSGIKEGETVVTMPQSVTDKSSKIVVREEE